MTARKRSRAAALSAPARDERTVAISIVRRDDMSRLEAIASRGLLSAHSETRGRASEMRFARGRRVRYDSWLALLNPLMS